MQPVPATPEREDEVIHIVRGTIKAVYPPITRGARWNFSLNTILTKPSGRPSAAERFSFLKKTARPLPPEVSKAIT